MFREERTAEGKKRRKRRGKYTESSSSEDENAMTKETCQLVNESRRSPTKKTRRRLSVCSSSDSVKSQGTSNDIKKAIKEEDLSADLWSVIKNEVEQAQPLDKKKIVDGIVLSDSEPDHSKLAEDFPQPLVLAADKETKHPMVTVHAKLVERLKPHQREGIRFMFDKTVEAIDEAQKENSGGGAILAHCTGLGKTLQVIALLHTVYTNLNFSFKSFLVLSPTNTVLDWEQEFQRWLNDQGLCEIDVFKLDKEVEDEDKMNRVREWHQLGGVFILGYSEFLALANPENKRISVEVRLRLQKFLVSPGPDFVVCDEGHLLKNETTAIFMVRYSFLIFFQSCFEIPGFICYTQLPVQALRQMETKRKIILTGAPLQNNLHEYHSMVQIVKPMFLGTKTEFRNL